MRFRLAFCAALATSSLCFAQPQFPAYTYFVPAIAEQGGPVYVIPGPVTNKSTIGFTVTGQACEQGGGTACFNAAGIVTVKGATAVLSVGDKSSFTGTIGGFSGTFHFGALLMSIEGLGIVQVFPSIAANGLGSSAPPQSFTLAPTTFEKLGFHKNFNRQNLQITLFVADDRYSDNTQGFLVNLISPTVTYDATMPSRKLIQVNGPCDWEAWDLGNGPCYPTAATDSESEVLGDDEGGSFVDTSTGKVIFLFGDTIGIKLPIEAPSLETNTYPDFHGLDAIATAPMPANSADFTIDFFPKSPATPQFVRPTDQPGKTPKPVHMGPDDGPHSGIHVNGKNYILVNTGQNSTLPDKHELEYSVLVEDDGNTSFKSGRTISTANKRVGTTLPPVYEQTGHFCSAVLVDLPLAYAQQLGLMEPGVLLVGEGEYRSESIYLAYMPASAVNVDPNSTNAATRYFTGLDANGIPQWSATEMDAVPVVYDNPPKGQPKSPDPGTVGDNSLRYFPELALWLMTWDGGRQKDAEPGIYFSVASAPWGPWSPQQLIYNPCDAHRYGQGFGDFIHYAIVNDKDPCNGEVDNNSGPAGPIIGTGGDPFFGTAKIGADGQAETAMTRLGAVYAPNMVPGLTSLNGGELTIDYNMSTWNPYAVVLMESNFTVAAPAY
jgi:hypothetical protein